ncbi:MAG: OmpH family outer membrane protein [Deltaproteobacteria bacterium]|nr:OmpH family outer membrane protein [Deltaproteobacteria bacterium]MBW2052754.1 OmpH family outer membrane protein [Deltaproteobacteria bacterium]MBW2139809.1 OmpH family outer membrane protein [Deltaproteobacteria bacterium]MBW2322713.1 OmpH family outer membrane protein [Deltaproteobacteria bacterium]
MHKRSLITNLLLCLTLVCFMAVAAPLPALSAEVIKIGVVNIQKVINESQKGKVEKEKLIKKFEQMRKDLDLRRAEIEKAKLELERQSSILAPDVRYDKEKTLKRKIRDFEDHYRDVNEQMKREEIKSTRPILEKLSQLITKYGQEKGYTLILEKNRSGVIYAPGTIDLTNELMKIYDASK